MDNNLAGEIFGEISKNDGEKFREIGGPKNPNFAPKAQRTFWKLEKKCGEKIG